MKRRNYDRETKDLAKSMYLRGDSFREIARALKCTHVAVSNWCREENWPEERHRIYAESAQIVAEKAKEILSGIQVESLTAYHKVKQRGLEELPRVKVASAKEAVYLIETGVKGLESVQQARLALTFLGEVAEIIKTEVPDKETVHRIEMRFRELYERYFKDHSVKPTELNIPEAQN